MKTLEHFTSVVQAMKLVEVDKSFPLYVQENRAHFEEICFLDIPI